MAVILCASLTSLLLRGRLRIGIDQPDEHRKFHPAPISRLGGLPIFITLLLGFCYATWKLPNFFPVWWPVIVTNCLVFAIGFIDDLKPLGAKVKLLGQIGAACILYSMDVSIDKLTNPFGEGSWNLGWWSILVTVGWLVAIPNIINLIDGMDGLATGFGLFLCMTLGVVGHFAGMPEVVLISVVMSGALAGFLFFNFPPARIFLGDGGAYLIGFFIASTSLVSSHKGSIVAALLVVIIALGVPILDTAFAIIRRAIRGVPIFRADAEHIHHRLILLGFSKTRALIALYSVCLVLSLIGISIFWNRGFSLPIAGGSIFLLGLGAARYLGYVKSWRNLRVQLNLALERRREMLYASCYGKLLQWEAERSETAEEFTRIFHLAVERLGMQTQATANFNKVHLSLITNLTCELYIPLDKNIPDVWMAKVEMLAHALNVATERWGALPGLNFQGVASQSNASVEAN